MPYTNAWNESVPLGTAARSSVDDLFRQMKLDLRERLNVLTTDFTTDPVVPLPAVLGNVVGKLHNVHWSAFTLSGSSNWTVPAGGAYIEDSAIASEMYAPLLIPPGTTITEVVFIANQNGGAAMTFNVVRILKTTGAVTDVFTVVTSSGAFNGFSTGVVSHVVDSLYIYAIKATTATSNRLYGAAVKYNTTDCRNTV